MVFWWPTAWRGKVVEADAWSAVSLIEFVSVAETEMVLVKFETWPTVTAAVWATFISEFWGVETSVVELSGRGEKYDEIRLEGWARILANSEDWGTEKTTARPEVTVGCIDDTDSTCWSCVEDEVDVTCSWECVDDIGVNEENNIAVEAETIGWVVDNEICFSWLSRRILHAWGCKCVLWIAVVAECAKDLTELAEERRRESTPEAVDCIWGSSSTAANWVTWLIGEVGDVMCNWGSTS